MYLSVKPIKRLVVLSVCLCCVNVINAADPQFRVNSYIPERFSDFQWRIDGSLQLEGYRDEMREFWGDEGTSDHYVTSRDQQFIQMKSDLNYIYESSSRFLICSLTANYTLHNYSATTQDPSLNGSKPGIALIIDGGKYIFSDCFISVAGSADWVYSHNLHDVNPDKHYRAYSVDGAIMIGWGRYYEGRFAATALNLTEELKKDGIIIREANYDELYQLTQMVRAYRLEYRPDERLHKIAALQDIIRFLNDRGILDDPGPYGYLLIQDIWDYFPNEQRYFGWRIRTGLGFDYFHSSRQSTDERILSDGTYVHTYHYEKTKDHHPYFILSAQHSKPLTRRWHLDFGGEYRYFLNSFTEAAFMDISYSPDYDYYYGHDYKEQNRYYTISLQAVLRYFLDGRTSLHLAGYYDFSRYQIIRIRNYSRVYLRLGLFKAIATFEYRISIPTTLQLNLNGERENYYREDFREYKSMKYYFSARIVHYLF